MIVAVNAVIVSDRRSEVLNFFSGLFTQLHTRNGFESCAPPGPQKHVTKESDGFHNQSNLLSMVG